MLGQHGVYKIEDTAMLYIPNDEVRFVYLISQLLLNYLVEKRMQKSAINLILFSGIHIQMNQDMSECSNPSI